MTFPNLTEYSTLETDIDISNENFVCKDFQQYFFNPLTIMDFLIFPYRL